MLNLLKITNFAIIEGLEAPFEPGLNVLTGETGAGKSIIVDALGLALGGRAYQEMVRSGADAAAVEVLFEVNSSGSKLNELIPNVSSEGEVIIKRNLARSGKNRAYVNDSLATVAKLQEVGKKLVDIYGQGEHQSLLEADTQLETLDAYGELGALREKYSEAFDSVRELEQRLNALIKAEQDRGARVDYLKFVIKEISEADLKENEREELERERVILANAESLMRDTFGPYEEIYSKEGSALEILQAALENVEQAAKLDNTLSESLKSLKESIASITDVAEELRKYSSNIEHDPGRLESIEDRLHLISSLEKKYGPTLNDVLERMESSKAELDDIQNREERIGELEKDLDTKKQKLQKTADKLTLKRKEAAGNLRKSVEKELTHLNMARTAFEARLIKKEEGPGPKGQEDIEFMLSPNPGEPLKSLAKIASGGELSRIMLAIKSAAVSLRNVPTLVFDEVDAGIGGATADALGRKLKALSKSAQVICVTHLPQIACYADYHLSVSKEKKGNRTVTSITQLDHEQRVEELSRMLAGGKVTKKAREHAEELLENARKLK